MKKILLIIFVLFITQLAKTQTGLLFAPTNSQWVQESNIWENPPPHLVKTYYNYIIKNDTIINNKKYSKLYRSFNKLLDSSLSCYNFWNYLFYDSNKVYIGNNPDSMNLLYDFNIVKGDSFAVATKYCMPQSSYKCVVDSVDSILLGNTLRKRIFINFHTVYLHPDIVWVEGIGDMRYGIYDDYGCLSELLWAGDSFLFDCFTDNNQTTYGSCYYGNCNTSAEETKINDDINLYPNPCSDMLNIEYKMLHEEVQIIINDITGRVIKKERLQMNEKTQVVVSDLKEGVYFVRLKTVTEIFNKKVIIQH